MSKMKTEFELDVLNNPNITKTATAKIIGETPKWKPYVKIQVFKDDQEITGGVCIPDKDLERFAINILKALKSKRLKL